MTVLLIGLLLAGEGVVFVDGKPADGVSVYALSEIGRKSVKTTTDREGGFELELPTLPEGNWIVCAVVGDRAETVRFQENVPMQIDVPPGVAIVGQLALRDVTATITIQPIEMPQRGTAAWALNLIVGSPNRAKSLVVAPPGTFRVTGLQPGKYRIYSSTSTGMTGILDVHAGAGETRVNLEVETSGSFSGEVRSAESGGPIGEAMLYLRSVDMDRATGISVRDGRFSKAGILPGNYFVHVTVDDRAEVGQEVPVTIRGGQETSVILHPRFSSSENEDEAAASPSGLLKR